MISEESCGIIKGHLNRVLYSEDKETPTEFLPWAECIQQYGNDMAENIKTYSKIELIGQLYNEIQTGNYHVQAMKRTLQAVLTDRGLLCPQTRERYYTNAKYSKRRAMCRFVSDESQADHYKNEFNRILSYTNQAHIKWQALFDEEYPQVSWEKVQLAMQLLFEEGICPFSSFRLTSEDVGYCRGDLSKYKYSENPQKAESIMLEWLNTVYFVFGQCEPISAWDWLKDVAKFSVPEGFEFLSRILPDCIWSEKLRISAAELRSPYEPSLATVQREEFIQQVKAFQKEDLSLWMRAFPALKQYLYPDIRAFQQRLDFDIGFDDRKLHKCGEALQDAFCTYLNCMEVNTSGSKDQGIAKISKELTVYFMNSSIGEDSVPLFLDRPELIFHLFRSPLYRYIYQAEDRNWNVSRVVHSAYFEYPLPITNQSLTADRELFLSIVNFCTESCRIKQIPFSKEPWDALWECIEQTVCCLSFQMEDLFSVRHTMYDLLAFQDTGYPIFDVWLKQKLSETKLPVYVAHWRTLMNKLCSPSRKQVDTLKTSINTYRSLFETFSVSEDNVWTCLKPLAEYIEHSKIGAVPTEAEISSIAESKNISVARQSENTGSQTTKVPIIHLKARKGPFSIMKSSRVPSTKLQTSPAKWISMIHTEWLLLQCVCGYAQHELMEAIYLFLTKEAENAG